ncbi:Cullin family protein [Trichomonas vaginalis G3]|uniref:Cullin family protein n=1 Tax=Trichomonas vaginalis (strain ATCC PRA-98 / G3) TaxID=412133 RepID=A2FH20_TRIV3|nr:ubiquitin protein ligase binding [Trichomonas vaginalis G3]EAX95788.1 Cullin family protein [Trichomonas vaginalis G3]KAI5536542.1 ubiquitin protein ligase binding [Trichomonas vaginalis G3]|eukprot:XP_001308718.1 Cullin family protein [Trichomonas vaginalis G3]
MRTKQLRAPLHDEFEIPNIAHITRGFAVKSMRPPNLIKAPFEIPEITKFANYQDQFQDAITHCLTLDQVGFQVQKIARISQSLSLSKDCAEAHEFISKQIIEFAKSIPTEISNCRTYEEIGQFWEKIQSKLSITTLSFSYLCVKSLGLRTYRDIFLEALRNEYTQNHELFETVANIIIEAYNESRNDCSSEKLKIHFIFLNDTGLFDTLFIEMLINSVLSIITPVIKESLNNGISSYLHQAQELSIREEKLASPLLTQTQLRKLTSSVNTAIFTSNLNNFVAGGLHELVTNNDKESISICAHFSTATNTTSTFTQDLARVFEEEVSKCFEKEDPIPDIINLYKALSSFNAAAFGTSSARVLTSGFERGFKVDDENTARKLELSIHKCFPLQVCDISPYYGLFKMLRCKDTFQSYHSLYLNRRSLECKPEQLENDKKFADNLRESCGTRYTEPIDQTFADINLSSSLKKKFFGKIPNSPVKSIFSPLILKREQWPTIEPITGIVPADIKQCMDDFETYFKVECRGKSIQWTMQLTKVSLECKGFSNLTELTCSGVVALVLLSIASGNDSVEKIIENTKLTEKDIQNAIAKMSQRKNGKVLLKPLALNPEASVEGGKLDVFYYVPATTSSSAKIPVNYDKQIEAAIMKILKEKQTLEKEELKGEVSKYLPFKFEDKDFDLRIKALDAQAYIKVDPSGKIHYIP